MEPCFTPASRSAFQREPSAEVNRCLDVSPSRFVPNKKKDWPGCHRVISSSSKVKLRACDCDDPETRRRNREGRREQSAAHSIAGAAIPICAIVELNCTLAELYCHPTKTVEAAILSTVRSAVTTFPYVSRFECRRRRDTKHCGLPLVFQMLLLALLLLCHCFGSLLKETEPGGPPPFS